MRRSSTRCDGGRPWARRRRSSAGLCDGEDRDAIAGAEDEQAAGSEGFTRYVDFAGHDEDAALIVVGIEGQDGAGGEDRFGVDAVMGEPGG